MARSRISRRIWESLTRAEQDLAQSLMPRNDWSNIKAFLADFRKFGGVSVGHFHIEKDGRKYAWRGPDLRSFIDITGWDTSAPRQSGAAAQLELC